MTGEQSVLVLGIVCVVLFIALVSRGGKKKEPSEANAVASNAARTPKLQNRTQRRKR